VVRQPYAVVVENLNAVRLYRVPDTISVVPPVMITQHCDHSERCLQSSEFISNRLRIDKTSSNYTLNDEVAKDNDEVRLLGIGRSHDLFQLAKIPMWRTYVQIGHDRDFETSVLRMPRVNRDCFMYHY
jgi:hypothetical protein